MMFKDGDPPSLTDAVLYGHLKPPAAKVAKKDQSGFKEMCVFHTDLTIATETRDILQILADEKDMPLEGFITKVLTEYTRYVLRYKTNKKT
jgi:hypothetical protein